MAKKAGNSGTGDRSAAGSIVWSGPQDEPLEGGWPDGWVEERQELR